MVERVKTGVPGLDEVLNGGIPKRSIILIAGGPGTGKSIMGMQYLWNGLQIGEPGVYVALEEHPVQVRVNMRQFNWDVKSYEAKGVFAVVDAFTAGVGEAAKREKYVVKDPTDVGTIVDVVRQAISDTGAQRVVVDSVSTLYLTKPSIARSVVLQLKKLLSGMGTTSMLISQVSVTERGFGGPGVEHAADGIVRLDLDEIDGELVRSLIIWKMRGTSHSMKRHLFEISDKGIVVYPDKVVKLKT